MHWFWFLTEAALTEYMIGDINDDVISMLTADELRITDEAHARLIDCDTAESF